MPRAWRLRLQGSVDGAPARPLRFKARAGEAPQQHTIVLAGLSQRQDDLYVGLIRHRTLCDNEHSYLCVSEAI